MEKTIVLDDKKLLIKRYKFRKTGQGGISIETTLPREIVEREARRNMMSLEDFIKNFNVVFRYGGFTGAYVTFEHRNKSGI